MNSDRSETSGARPNHSKRGVLHWLECRRGNGWNPQLFYACAYVLAGVTFLVMMNMHVLVYLPDLPYYPLAEVVFGKGYNHGLWHAVLILSCWSIHFVRRTIETLFIHVYVRSDSLTEVVGALVYYSFFGTWVGWSVNLDLYTWLLKAPPAVLIWLGTVCFITGEILNCRCHWLLMRMRRPARHGPVRNYSQPRYELSLYPPTQYPSSDSANCTDTDNSTPDPDVSVRRGKPDSCLFKWTWYPHYCFEFVTWVGFALISFTWASCIFAFTSGAVMSIRACRQHNSNRCIGGRQL